MAVGREGVKAPAGDPPPPRLWRASDSTARSYAGVMVVWVLVLAGLYLLQEYFG